VKVIYGWIALLVIVITGVGLFIIQWYTMPVQPKENPLPNMRKNLAQRYEARANMFSDSAMAMAQRLKRTQGSLTPKQEEKVNSLLDRAKNLKEKAAQLQTKDLSENETGELLRACNSIYGEASAICNQLQVESGK